MTMTAREATMQTDLPLPGKRQGKVRDIYEATTSKGQEALVMIATDRMSAFDVVLPNGIPGKGIILTQISRFWFEMIEAHFDQEMDHHLISTDPSDIVGLSSDQIESLRGRTMVGRRCRVVPVECVVRGYLAGSGWRDYVKTQTVCGIPLPAGLPQSARLPEPIFTPATKATKGHDENISFAQAAEIAGPERMAYLRDLSIRLYQMGHDYASSRGIILADTKFEFGLPLDGSNDRPILIDEVLTPDSSRFWPADQYESGRDQPNFDKQYVRNYLQELTDAGQWDKTPPGPVLPEEIVRNTLSRYIEAYRLLTGDDPEL